LCKKVEGAGFPFQVESLEDGVDDAVDALDIDKAHHQWQVPTINQDNNQEINQGQTGLTPILSAQIDPQKIRNSSVPTPQGSIHEIAKTCNDAGETHVT
jgi:hypothetical protein